MEVLYVYMVLSNMCIAGSPDESCHLPVTVYSDKAS